MNLQLNVKMKLNELIIKPKFILIIFPIVFTLFFYCTIVEGLSSYSGDIKTYVPLFVWLTALSIFFLLFLFVERAKKTAVVCLSSLFISPVTYCYRIVAVAKLKESLLEDILYSDRFLIITKSWSLEQLKIEWARLSEADNLAANPYYDMAEVDQLISPLDKMASLREVYGTYKANLESRLVEDKVVSAAPDLGILGRISAFVCENPILCGVLTLAVLIPAGYLAWHSFSSWDGCPVLPDEDGLSRAEKAEYYFWFKRVFKRFVAEAHSHGSEATAETVARGDFNTNALGFDSRGYCFLMSLIHVIEEEFGPLPMKPPGVFVHGPVFTEHYVPISDKLERFLRWHFKDKDWVAWAKWGEAAVERERLGWGWGWYWSCFSWLGF
uniref:Uncharacterized protein n=1 Tax=Balamuthia mandrillaris TaxID=66527 RepID=A0A0K1HSJ9_9EUKA|nr:hypothetical protein [Balamuthia mandrillaris]AKT94892.1 hypothetical protein [Balamuthia mandrillaris]